MADTQKGPKMKLHVPEMSCGHCTSAIEKGVKAADPSATVSTELEGRTVKVETKLTEAAIIDAISLAGYEAQPAN